MSRYTIGVDFGTESGRAVLVDVADGRKLATAVYPYANGVIDERLPVRPGRALEPDWALQDPDDYLRVFQTRSRRSCASRRGPGRRDRRRASTSPPARCCPTKADGTPLCFCPEWRANPHAWVKLWKHHAAQPEADQINEVARETGEAWLDRYGGKISSEWFFSKALQILDEAPEVYAAADRLIEAADWVVWQLTGVETRNACTAATRRCGRSARASRRNAYFAALDPRWRTSSTRRCRATSCPSGERAGGLTDAGRRVDRPEPGHRRGRRQRGRPCRRAGRDRHRAGPHGHDHGHLHLPHGPGRRRSTSSRACAATSRTASSPASSATRPASPAWATTSPGSSRTACPAAYEQEARERGMTSTQLLEEKAGRARAGRVRPAGARLVERQPLRPGGRRPDRPAPRRDPGDQAGGDLPRPDRGHRLRHARDHRGLRGATACRSTSSSPAAACPTRTSC